MLIIYIKYSTKLSWTFFITFSRYSTETLKQVEAFFIRIFQHKLIRHTEAYVIQQL